MSKTYLTTLTDTVTSSIGFIYSRDVNRLSRSSGTIPSTTVTDLSLEREYSSGTIPETFSKCSTTRTESGFESERVKTKNGFSCQVVSPLKTKNGPTDSSLKKTALNSAPSLIAKCSLLAARGRSRACCSHFAQHGVLL